MKRLHTITLPDQAEWVNQYSTSPVIGTVRYTTAGVPILSDKHLSGGDEITLEFQEGVEWASLWVVQAVKQIERQVGGVFELEWEGEIMRVTFNRQKPSNFNKIMPGSDHYTGTINLLRI